MNSEPVPGFTSVSTWSQPAPTTSTADRQRVIERVASMVNRRGAKRLRVAVDGFTAAGKTTFSHELAAALRRLGRPTLQASLDDFKHPWRHAREHGYDRISGDGYYRNTPDFESARELLLRPSGPHGSGRVVLCAHDPLTSVDHRDVAVDAPANAVLIVDSVFAFRPAYNEFWDYRIWLDVPAELSLRRGIERDREAEGLEEAERLHRDRYHVAEQIYIDEVDPQSLADTIVDNTVFDHPEIRERP